MIKLSGSLGLSKEWSSVDSTGDEEVVPPSCLPCLIMLSPGSRTSESLGPLAPSKA